LTNFPFFLVERYPEQKTAILYMNRPEKRNALNFSFWRDFPLVINDLELDEQIRCVIIAGKGKSFSMGLDLEEFFTEYKDLIQADSGDKRDLLLKMLTEVQGGINSVADGDNIYIAAVHKHCIGGGLDLIAACDLRLCSQDAIFSVRETKIAIVADLGSLSRLPPIIGQGNTRMLALTGRDFKSAEAYRMGLVNEVYSDGKELIEGALKLAEEIANNPILAVRGTKKILNYGLNHSQEDGLRQVLLWNTAFIDTADSREMLDAFLNRRRPNFQ